MKLLTVGINNYVSQRIQDLSGCVNDANFWLEYFRSIGLKSSDTRIKLNHRAKRKDIRSGLDWLFKKSKNELVIFAYSGHGTNFLARNPEDELNDEYDEAICPADVEDDLSCITDNYIVEQFIASSKKTFIAIFDSCFAGGMSRSGSKKPKFLYLPRDIQARRTAEKKRIKINSKILEGDRKYICISACQEDEVSYDDTSIRPPMGAFTRAAKNAIISTRVSTYEEFINACEANCRSQKPKIETFGSNCSLQNKLWT